MTSPESPDMDRLREVVTEAIDAVIDGWMQGDPWPDDERLADAVLAALLPVHREMVLAEAAHMILNHRDRHFPADGNDVQRRARRILQIAVQVVSPTPTREQLAEKLMEMGVLDRAASTPPGAPGSPQTAERATPAETGTVERVGRFEELLAAEYEQFDQRGELLRSIVEYRDAPSGTASVPAAPGVGQETAKGPRCWSCGGTGMLCSPGQLCMPSSEGATACTCPGAIPCDKCRPQEAYAEVIRRLRVATTDLSRVTRERDEARDLVRRYEGTDNDSELTYAELEQERDRLAVDLYRAQDCGHDLERFDAHTVALTRVRKIVDLLRQPGGAVSNEVVAQLLDTALGDAPGPAGMDPAEYAAVERLAGDVAALTAERDRLARELETMTEVAKSNKRHVGYLVEHSERLADTIKDLAGHATPYGDIPDEPGTAHVVRAKTEEER